jgi:hypothetical protein
LAAAGANATTKAQDFLEEEKAFIFVFETGATFGSKGKNGRPSLHIKLKREVIKIVSN